VYGAVRTQTGVQPNEFTFTGEQVDTSGLQYLRARYYDPALGRFLARDPLPVGNRYAYVGNDPVNYSDPTGYCHIIPCFDSPLPVPWPFAPVDAPDMHLPDIHFDPDVRGNWEYWYNRLRGRDIGNRAEGPPQGPPRPRSLDPSRWYQPRCWQIRSLRGQIVCYTTWVAGIVSVARTLGLDAIVQQYLGPDSVADKEGRPPVSPP
jgi:RHS repeat-associated protein